MVFAVDIGDETVDVWHRDGDDAVVEHDESYHPSIFAAADGKPLDWLGDALASDPKVAGMELVDRRTSLRDDGSTVLRLDLHRPSEVTTLAREIRTVHELEEWAPGTFRVFNVDLSPKFRYCLETGTDPTPAERLRSVSLSLSDPALADEDVGALRCDGELAGETARMALEAVADTLADVDPDVLVLSNADLVPLLHDRAGELGVDLNLGRQPGHTQLAGESTFESYGRVGHSPARYNVPGRAIVDTSNSFLWSSGGIPGMVDLVKRAKRPLQEVAWGSIGNNFTAIQIREATERGVLVPWRAWEHEEFKSARTLHDADRGSVTFEPETGFHEDVVEVDFASLFPNIMRTRNLSPETVRCDCHDTADVPNLGYSVCPEKEGFVGDVLGPIIDDRAAIKRRIKQTDDPEEVERLEGRSEALKWILVTCFGYQGFNNSKFGRIEVHESINAYGREILLDAKTRLEDGGWRLLHGIVDSLWAMPREDAPVGIHDLCGQITEAVGIDLEFEAAFDWVAFVPLRDGRGGSLTSYFGKRRDGEYKYRGIEVRQRSTPTFVGRVQADLIETLDEHREAEPVVDRLARHLNELRSGNVDPADLVIRTRASKPVEGYDQRTRTVAALERYADHGIPRNPGQDVQYVIVDDEKQTRERVRLPWEADRYDPESYSELTIRAAESVLLPLEWDRDGINEYLRETADTKITSWGR